MANAPFTRDEVILALDVLYSAGEDNLSPRSELIAGLSELLNLLPIYPKEKRPDNFRNCVGVSHQIERFKEGYSIERKKWNVGTIFFEVDAEYTGRHNELHSIAQSIRRNLSYFNQFPFGGVLEQDGFPEGALLSHLHRLIELRDGQKISLEERCAVCQLEPEIIYKSCGSLLQNHLMIPPAELDGGKKYSAGQFMTLCPNCHAALHRFRPWLQKENCEELLR